MAQKKWEPDDIIKVITSQTAGAMSSSCPTAEKVFWGETLEGLFVNIRSNLIDLFSSYRQTERQREANMKIRCSPTAPGKGGMILYFHQSRLNLISGDFTTKDNTFLELSS